MGELVHSGLLLVLSLAAAGCSLPPAGGAPPRNLLSWQGASAAALEQALGPPDSIDRLASGETVLAYRWSRTDTTGGYAVAMGGYPQLGTQYVPMRITSLNCFARFTLGPDGRVRDIGLQGNGCFAEHR